LWEAPGGGRLVFKAHCRVLRLPFRGGRQFVANDDNAVQRRLDTNDGENEMNRMTRTLAVAIMLSSLSFAACHKGGSEVKQVTPEEAKKNAELEQTAPQIAPTVVGDVERINLAVSGSMDSYRQHKWSDVVAYLNTARQETEKALADAPDKHKYNVTRETLEEMKDALDRTIQAAENRSQEVEAQLVELQTRAGALKMVLPPQRPTK
jgi:preprotein translocase subunit SecD